MFVRRRRDVFESLHLVHDVNTSSASTQTATTGMLCPLASPTPAIGQNLSPRTPLSTMRDVWLKGYDEVEFDRTLSQHTAGARHWLEIL